MTPLPADRLTRDVLSLVGGIPGGYVATHQQIATIVKAAPRHVATLLAGLDDDTRARLPWWRVVADGGAIGRHLLRDEQMTRLRADGVVLSPVGIVQDLAARRVPDLTRPPATPFALPAAGTASRARGSRDKPSSTV
jgi:alkylated DNA nucleotide flippase Atl1